MTTTLSSTRSEWTRELGWITSVVRTAVLCTWSNGFIRVNRDILELTVTIDDPKMYTKPWVAADKLTLHLLPPDVDMGEMLCSPAEMSNYNKEGGCESHLWRRQVVKISDDVLPTGRWRVKKSS